MRETVSRGVEFILFCVALLWSLAAARIADSSAHGLAGQFAQGAFMPIVGGLIFLFLLVMGFQLLDRITVRRGSPAEALPMPRRATSAREWTLGAAAGWGTCVLALLPLFLSRNLHADISSTPQIWATTLLSVVTLAVITLAEEVALRGYALRRLSAAIGPSLAAIATSLIFAAALLWMEPPPNLVTAFLDCFLFGLLLAMAYLRTHALWTGWGAHFAYRATMALVFGLPIAGHTQLPSVVEGYASGPRWLSGGAFGADAALFTAMALILATAWLYRATKDYAWNYTHRTIAGAGDEVTVAPPAAHVAMEAQAAAAPPPLVQILGATPQGRSVAGLAVAANSTGEAPPPRT